MPEEFTVNVQGCAVTVSTDSPAHGGEFDVLQIESPAGRLLDADDFGLEYLIEEAVTQVLEAQDGER